MEMDMIVCSFIVGLLLGSFLNVCIYRLPRKRSILLPPSHCTRCERPLRPSDLVPVLSWLWHGGKCGFCGFRVSGRYAFVEILTGISWVLVYVTLGWNLELLRALILLSFLIVIAVIDYDHRLILDKVLFAMAGAGILLRISFAILSNAAAVRYMVDALLGFLLGGAILYLIALISRGGMGGGDIKFAAVLGLWFGWKFILSTLFFSFLLGGVISVLLLLLKVKNRRDEIPFGPFMAAAAWISYLYGDEITYVYRGLLS